MLFWQCSGHLSVCKVNHSCYINQLNADTFGKCQRKFQKCQRKFRKCQRQFRHPRKLGNSFGAASTFGGIADSPESVVDSANNVVDSFPTRSLTLSKVALTPSTVSSTLLNLFFPCICSPHKIHVAIITSCRNRRKSLGLGGEPALKLRSQAIPPHNRKRRDNTLLCCSVM